MASSADSPIVILAGARTPMGRFQGGLSARTATDLGATAIAGAIARSAIGPADVDFAYLGNVVAAGTGNDFAGALGLIPSDGTADDLAARVDRALADPVAVDVVARTSHTTDAQHTSHAATVCIAGFPAVVNARAEAMVRPRGPSRYTLATLLAIGGMRPTRFHLACRGGPDDGRVVDQRCAVVAAANTGLFGGGMRICPDARPDDGLLDVCLVGDVGRIALLRAFPKVRTGAHLDHPEVTILRAAEVDLEAVEEGAGSGAEPLRADGEPFGTLPCTLSARPGALWVAGAVPGPVGRV